MRNVFDGWTKQAFGIARDGRGRYCALGWIVHQMIVSRNERVIELVGEALTAHGQRRTIAEVNDRLRWTPDQFRALGVLVPDDWFADYKRRALVNALLNKVTLEVKDEENTCVLV